MQHHYKTLFHLTCGTYLFKDISCLFLSRLALDALHESVLFQGPEGNKLFNHNIDLLEKNHYCLAGQLVALSIAQDGPGPFFFNEHLFDLMVGVECDLSTFQIYILHTDSQDILQHVRFLSRLQSKLFEHEAIMPSVQISSKGPGTC